MTDLVRIPFRDTEVLAVDVDGKPHVILKAAIEALGLDFEPQRKKLAGKSWACTSLVEVQVPGDSQRRRVVAVDVRTFLMLLATIDERRVAEEARPLLVAYQSEVADVIEAYWTQGGAINPRATEEQLEDLLSLADRRLALLAKARGLVSADWLEQKARITVARGLGEAPEIEAADQILYVEDYLRGKGLTKDQARVIRSPFGNRLARLYAEVRGHAPAKSPGEVGGRVRPLNTYQERDRELFDQVWDQHYAAAFGSDLFGGAA